MNTFAMIALSACLVAMATAQGQESNGGVSYLSNKSCRRLAATSLATLPRSMSIYATMDGCEGACCAAGDWCMAGAYNQITGVCALYKESGAENESILAYTQNSQGNTMYYFDSCKCPYYDDQENIDYLNALE